MGKLLLILFISLTQIAYGGCKKVSDASVKLRKIASESEQPVLDHCVYKDIYGCVFKKQYNCNENSDTLVIYLRGHWLYKGQVPWNTKIRDNSLKQVIEYYGLDKVYDNVQDPMLISSSSNVGFTITEIKSALEQAQLPENANIVIAAHSGAYHGLQKTLDYLNRSEPEYSFKLKKIIMLDNFYFHSSLSKKIKSHVERGVACNGFYTKHNKARYLYRFNSVLTEDFCPIDFKKYHNQTVNLCLESYLKEDRCDIDT